MVISTMEKAQEVAEKAAEMAAKASEAADSMAGMFGGDAPKAKKPKTPELVCGMKICAAYDGFDEWPMACTLGGSLSRKFCLTYFETQMHMCCNLSLSVGDGVTPCKIACGLMNLIFFPLCLTCCCCCGQIKKVFAKATGKKREVGPENEMLYDEDEYDEEEEAERQYFPTCLESVSPEEEEEEEYE
jgi:hypothetical protein